MKITPLALKKPSKLNRLLSGMKLSCKWKAFQRFHLPIAPLKNFRNVTLIDLDKDGVEDILWGANNLLFAQTYKELLWERILGSTAIYPPSVADLDGNGSPEIVQATGGSQSNSSIYLLNIKGQDRPGWPLSFDGHWILTAPALSDLDGDGALEIIFNERDDGISRIHIVNQEGEPYNENWPVAVLGTLALTPSIGDVDQDGEKRNLRGHHYYSLPFSIGRNHRGWLATGNRPEAKV